MFPDSQWGDLSSDHFPFLFLKRIAISELIDNSEFFQFPKSYFHYSLKKAYSVFNILLPHLIIIEKQL